MLNHVFSISLKVFSSQQYCSDTNTRAHITHAYVCMYTCMYRCYMYTKKRLEMDDLSLNDSRSFHGHVFCSFYFMANPICCLPMPTRSLAPLCSTCLASFMSPITANSLENCDVMSSLSPWHPLASSASRPPFCSRGVCFCGTCNPIVMSRIMCVSLTAPIQAGAIYPALKGIHHFIEPNCFFCSNMEMY